MTSIKLFIIFTMTELHLAVVLGSEWVDQLVPENSVKFLVMLLKVFPFKIKTIQSLFTNSLAKIGYVR